MRVCSPFFFFFYSFFFFNDTATTEIYTLSLHDALPISDTTPPVVTVPASIARGPTQYDGTPVDFTVSAYDLVDGAITEIACTWSSGSLFPVGTTTAVTCSVTDGHGNEG